MSHAYKKVAAKPPKQYRPADAVRAGGDLWRWHAPVYDAIGVVMGNALSDLPHDRQDGAIMDLCERGVISRVDY